jgi:hypothetical protein
MNIFVLSYDVEECAKWHLDKHVVKMPLETAQLLCTALWYHGGKPLYKKAHKNHPCKLWTRESQANFNWLVALGFSLCSEYQYRYGKTHKCLEVLDDCKKQSVLLPEFPFSEPPQAMPDEYKRESVIEAYRAYYIGGKKNIASWKGREKPFWWRSEDGDRS